MSRGWEQHRLETDTRWQATGVLTDQNPYKPDVGVHVAEVETTLGERRIMWIEGRDSEPKVGALGWAQFFRA